MKAIIQKQYGSPDQLKVSIANKPIIKANEVLVKVYAASVNAADWHLMRADPFLVRLMYGGFRRPAIRTLGADIAGRIELVGRDVTQWQVGDLVFGDLSESGFGGYAEYAAIPEDMLAPKPEGYTFEEAATLPVAGLAALQSLRDAGGIEAGQKVLINGASGGVGTFAVQIAGAFGAEVTAVASTRHLDMLRQIGAHHVIDYTEEDFTQSDIEYDLILDIAAYRPPWEYRPAMTPEGTYVFVGGETKRIFQIMAACPLNTLFSKQKITSFLSRPNQADLQLLKDMAEEGQIRPVIDSYYSLDEVADAIRYMEDVHPSGKIVIQVAEDATIDHMSALLATEVV